MSTVLAAAAEVAAACDARGLRYCLIGGVAVLRWGEARLTRDVDLTVLAGFGEEHVVVDALLTDLAGRMAGARGFAIEHRTLLLQASNGTPVDVALGALPFEERCARRASVWEAITEAPVKTCCAEDLIVHKVFAGRERDWVDVEGVIHRQAERLDVGLIVAELEPLLELKEDTAAMGRLRALLG